MDHHYAEINGVRLHFVSAGSGPLMLFVHGFPEFWYAWKNQLEAFSEDHHAVALDMRGYNLSDKPADVKAYRAKLLVEDLRQLIDYLGGRPCILVAHDWGGAVAWNFAAQHPDYLRKLVIINAPHPVLFSRALRDNPEQIEASRYMLLFREEKAERVLSDDNFRRMERMLFPDGGGPRWLTDQELEHYREAWSQPGALTGGLNYYRASPVHPPLQDGSGKQAPQIDPRAFTVTVPTLVVWGERDKALLPLLIEGLEEVVPRLTLKRVPEGTHWIVHEYPEQVNALIRDFISH